ncbi:MAG: tandem-95 repeat protein [Candidatus Cloacimonetes bacterium]|nr:tandem-95 repeat protein [Candidatus Cloacimonadota bacterium]
MRILQIVVLLLILITLQAEERDFPRPWEVVYYTNSTVAYCEVTIDGVMAAQDDEVGAFVAGECRGLGYVINVGNQAVCSMNIQGNYPEPVEFAVWDESEDIVCSVSYATMTNPGGDIGYPPNLLPISAVSDPNQNLAPVWNLPAEFSFPEDGNLIIHLPDYAFDPEGSTLQYSCPQSGELNVYIYQGNAHLSAAANYFGSNDLVFAASDGENTSLDTVMVNVLPVNDPPVLFISDDLIFEEDGSLNVDLNEYVIDVDGDLLEFTIANNVNIIVEFTDMTMLLSSAVNWNGMENLLLTVSDGEATDSDNFLVTVTPVNDAPLLNLPAVISFAEDGSLIINLTNYAFDPDGDVLSFAIMNYPENITAAINNNYLLLGALPDWNGSEDIMVTVADPAGLETFSVSLVTVTAVNDAPVLELPAEFIFEEDNVLELDFTEYVSDVDGDSLNLLVSGNVQLQIMITDLEVDLSSQLNWYGSENLIFTVTDGINRATASEQVTVIVNPVNDAPAINLPEELSFYTYSELTEDFAEYVSDVENDELALSVYGNNEIAVNISSLLVTFSAPPGWTGSEDITFTVSDGVLSSSADLNVEVLELSSVPVINLPALINIPEDTSSTRNFGNYIFNEEGFDLALNCSGNLEITTDIIEYMVTFSAPADWNGEELLTFTISDTAAGFYTSDDIMIRFLAVNDAPVIDLPDSISFPEDTEYTLDCSPYITDIDNDEFTLSCSGSEQILVSISNLEMHFNPSTNYFGSEFLTVTVNDNSGRAISSDTLQVDVAAVNDAPEVSFPAEVIFAEDEIYELALNDYVFDVDDSELAITAESDFGCDFNLLADEIQLLPPADYNGSGVIIITVADTEFSVNDTIGVQINPVNDAPVINLPDQFTFAEDTTFTFDINDYASDVDGDNLFVSESSPFLIFVEISGSNIQLETLNNWNGSAQMTITVSDGVLSVSDEVDIIVTPVNDAPVLNGFEPEETELLFYGVTSLTFSVNVYDVDSDLVFQWFLNEELQGENTASYTYNFEESGVFNVRAEINDEEYMLDQAWDIEIFGGPGWVPVIYTNSTVCYGIVSLDGEAAGENDLVGAFVAGECRGIGEITVQNNIAYTSFLIQGETLETVNFKLYAAAAEMIFDILYTAQTNPGGDLGYPPNLLPLAAFSEPGPGWVASTLYENWTTVHLAVTIDGEPAADTDIVGAFAVNGECLGVGSVQQIGEIAYSTFPVFQDDEVDFSFHVWDADVNMIYFDYDLYTTDPGNELGSVGNELPVAVSSIPGPDWEPVIYTNSTTAYCIVRLDSGNAAAEDIVGVFVDEECRGTGEIFFYEGESRTTIQIQGEMIETCHFRLWNSTSQQILDCDFETETSPGGDIGYPPNELELVFWTFELPELQVFPRPWLEVYYTNSTIAYGSMSVDDNPVPSDHEIGAFIDNECRGVGYTVNNGTQSIFTLNIQGDVPEPVQFNYFDPDSGTIYSIDYITVTAPGGDIGYPPDLLPLNLYTNFPPVVTLPPGFSFDEDEVVIQDMSEYIIDPDGDELIMSASGNVNINILIDGVEVTAWGNLNWFGIETISYTVDDGHGHIVEGTLVLEVLSVNDAPDVNLPYSFTLQEDQPLTVDFSVFISDVEGDAWTLSASGNTHVNIVINGSMVTLQPEQDWNGQETITFMADDGEDVGSDDLIVIVNPQPDPPVVNFPDSLQCEEDGSLTININDYIYDPDGDEFTVSWSGNTQINIMQEDDLLIFTPAANWYGSEMITINADDGTTRRMLRDVFEFIVISVWDEPWLELPESFTFEEDVPETIDLEEYFEVFEGDEFLFTASGNDTISIIFDEAMMTVSAPENWYGSETVVITLDDAPLRMTVSDTLLFTVDSVNDVPVLLSWLPEELEFEVPLDSLINFSVDVEDVDGDVDYRWYLDGSEIPDLPSYAAFAFDAVGDYEVECQIYDADHLLNVIWNITAYEVATGDNDIYLVTTLLGNYPNPFNPDTAIRMYLKEENLPATLTVFNLKGQIIRNWQIDKEGLNEIHWDGSDWENHQQTSGVYFYSLRGRNFVDIHKMLMIK